MIKVFDLYNPCMLGYDNYNQQKSKDNRKKQED